MQAAEPDTSDIPETTEDWFKKARLRLDQEIERDGADEVVLWRIFGLSCMACSIAVVIGTVLFFFG